ncbi:MAG: DUF4173 domain-containing protein [Patescibacteria group bacterium]
MTTDLIAMSAHTPTRDLKYPLTVLAITAVLTTLFHTLVFSHPYGIALAIFILVFVAGIHVAHAVTGREANYWAYIFLVPVLFATSAGLLYANPTVSLLAPILTIISLCLFSFWFTSAKTRIQDVKSFLCLDVLLETVLPFQNSDGIFQHKLLDSRGAQIRKGILVALPFLFIIGILFLNADALFRQFVDNIFHFSSGEELFARLVTDVIFALIITLAGWALITRALDQRKPQGGNLTLTAHPVTLATFLSLLNVLFLTFIAFQSVYFFGGEAYIQAHGVSYASYAREGFFQLLFVAGITFAIVWYIYQATDMRNRLTKILSLVLVAQTWIVIASAIRRLALYMDAYGYTVSRFWAMAVILFIAAVLFVAFFGALTKLRGTHITSATLLIGLYVFSGLLLINVERKVAEININKFLRNEHALDLAYLENLSTDALPELIRARDVAWPEGALTTLQDTTWPEPRINPIHCATENLQECHRDHLRNTIDATLQRLTEDASKDWRNLVLTQYRHLAMYRLQ